MGVFLNGGWEGCGRDGGGGVGEVGDGLVRGIRPGKQR